LIDLLAAANSRVRSDNEPRALPSPNRRHKIRCDVAVFLGTANTVAHVRGQGVIFDEPSVVAIEKSKGVRRVKAIGEEAIVRFREGGIEAAWPIWNGVIADVQVAEQLLSHVLRKAWRGRPYGRRAVAVGVPLGATSAEQAILSQTVAAAGASSVYLIHEPMAAAIGADMPVTEAIGSMVVVIGAGVTEVAVISLGGIAYSTSVRVGGRKMDEAIVSYLRHNYDLLIGEATAERIKKQVGIAIPPADGVGMIFHIKGRCASTGVPKEIIMNEGQICEALSGCVSTIVEGVRMTLEIVAPELSADIVGRGIVLAGGGALLKGMDELIRSETSLPVEIAKHPLHCSARGAGRALDEEVLQSVLFEYER
jgi:rod shape-determining protein MreB